MPLNEKTSAVLYECQCLLHKIDVLAAAFPQGNEARSFRLLQRNLLEDFVKCGLDEDLPYLLQTKTRLATRLKQLTETYALYQQQLTQIPELANTCRLALHELDYMAAFYPIGKDPWFAFRESLRADLDQYAQWELGDQLQKLTLIAHSCDDTRQEARLAFMINHKKFAEQRNQQLICSQFLALYDQIKRSQHKDAKTILHACYRAYNLAKKLKSLLDYKTSAEDHIAMDSVNLERKIAMHNGGCSFTYVAFLKLQLNRDIASLLRNDKSIIRLCQALQLPCLKMYRFILQHLPTSTAIVTAPVPQLVA